jgi:biopolymer transport protein ExbD
MAINLHNKDQGPIADINVTPLVDVMLVLLVVFIVTAPLIVPQSMKINLPKTVVVNKADQVKNSILLINSAGEINLDGRATTDEQLISIFKEKASQNYQLQIRADQIVPYGRVAEIMALAQTNGVTKISFATTVKKK